MRYVFVAAALAATPAQAGVMSATPTSFVIESTVTVAAPPQAVWDVLRAPQRWWDPKHSYSGDAKNLYLDPQATGCFCERLPAEKGSVEHGRVLHVASPRMLRLSSALRPLQGEAVTGTLTFALAADSAGTKITLTYVVA